ncbi:hypothetical protein AVEN_256402-1 [Araneus ventricosus]|uniref:Uncharacterized protein n=1 Tax=Araneus ventricosus TaxID=182803 RepID=A0A4Y2FY94_ARAVE|nr:hypothetical protein AVEN_256402-1 [Araneus ventricosus]
MPGEGKPTFCVIVHWISLFSARAVVMRSKNEAMKKKLAGADDLSVPSAPLTYLELFSRAKGRNKTIWLISPVHHWYQGSRPGGCLSIDCSRLDQTTLTRFLSGHIRSLTFADNSKCFEICPKCTAEQATPDHILACLGLSQQALISNPLLTLDFFRVHRLMDVI